jgi:hypothetical protein
VPQGGTELCRIEGFDRRKAISELKVSIEAEAGLAPALTLLSSPQSQVELQDHLTLEDAVGQALVDGVIQLYAQTLKKIVVADELKITPGEVTDSKLAELCDSIREDPIDILVLCGCRHVTNLSCLVQLSTISHLDLSSCRLGAEGCFQLAGVLKDMGALMKFDISMNKLYAAGAKALAEGLRGNQLMTELNLAGNEMGKDCGNRHAKAAMSGIIALADVIPGMGAISSVNLLKNNIDVEQAEDLVSILKEHPTLKSLCGNKGNETKLHMCSKMSGAGDAIMLAREVVDNGALTSLNLSSNNIGAHWDSAQRKMVVTPEGTFIRGRGRLLFSRCILCRPSCYR